MAAAHERERDVEVLVAAVHLPLQQRELLAGDLLEVAVRERARGGEARRRRVELRELQLDALGDRARADARRVELLDDGEHGLDARGVGPDVRGDRGGDRLRGLGQVAVVIDGVDDRAADRELLRRQVRELELPPEVVLQRVSGLVGEFRLALAGARPGRLGLGRGRLGPLVADLDDDVVLGGLAGLRILAAFARQRLERGGGLAFLLELQQHVALERLLDLRQQLGRGQLQQPDGLLQLRRHRQLLADPELQGRFHHAAGLPRPAPARQRPPDQSRKCCPK